MLKPLLLQLILILLNAFFAATEIALISLNEKKVRAQAEDGDKKAKKMLRIIENPTKFLSTIQVGITLAGFLGSAFAADSFAGELTEFIIKVCKVQNVSYDVMHTVSVVIITLILSYFTLVLGELVPKRVAMKHKEKLAGAACGFISFLATVLKPIIWFLTVSTNGMLRLFGINPHEKEEPVSEEDIVIMLDAGADEGTLKEDDIEYIKNVFKLERRTAADIMTPRSALVAVPSDISHEKLIEIIESEGYSRIPVYEDNVDKIVGILRVKDYLLNCHRPDFKLEDVLLEPEFVPETVHLDALFKDMQDTRVHMVIVLNEYGLTLGVLTMEDIIEELVGEIWDEQDEADEVIAPILMVEENVYRVLSSVTIDEFFEFFELEKNEEIVSTTVNGWLSEHFGSIPEVDSELEYENLTVRVTDADEQKANEVLVTVTPRVDDDDEEDDDVDEPDEDEAEDKE
ncbi:MAG: HlyC/CorC family transporter [Clostridia bacterium]|nr:HlyC/CorC family transporter [Clostridia bacterium]